MQVAQRAGHAAGEIQPVLGREAVRRGGNVLGQRLAGRRRHQRVEAVVVTPDSAQRHDVGVAQPAKRRSGRGEGRLRGSVGIAGEPDRGDGTAGRDLDGRALGHHRRRDDLLADFDNLGQRLRFAPIGQRVRLGLDLSLNRRGLIDRRRVVVNGGCLVDRRGFRARPGCIGGFRLIGGVRDLVVAVVRRRHAILPGSHLTDRSCAMPTRRADYRVVTQEQRAGS
jgi:hypothetical protein